MWKLLTVDVLGGSRMNKDIWVYVEQIESKIANVSLELLGEAQRLKGQMKEQDK